MTTEQSDTVRDGIADLIYSTSKFFSSMAIIGAAMWFFFAPVLKPFIEMPEALSQVTNDVKGVQVKIEYVEARITNGKNLRYATFLGKGLITHKTNSHINVLYVMNRLVSCEVLVTPRFYDINTNIMHVGKPRSAVKSPVVRQHNPFNVRIKLPEDLPTGKFTYLPTLKPIDCGAYTEITAPHSGMFDHINLKEKAMEH